VPGNDGSDRRNQKTIRALSVVACDDLLDNRRFRHPIRRLASCEIWHRIDGDRFTDRFGYICRLDLVWILGRFGSQSSAPGESFSIFGNSLVDLVGAFTFTWQTTCKKIRLRSIFS
jgi:hypothetical protein